MSTTKDLNGVGQKEIKDESYEEETSSASEDTTKKAGVMENI